MNKNNALGPAPDPVPDASSRRSIHAVVIASGNEYRLSVKRGREREEEATEAAVPIPNLEIRDYQQIRDSSIINSKNKFTLLIKVQDFTLVNLLSNCKYYLLVTNGKNACDIRC